ncbi:MAG: hypothetical protein ABW185_28105, partial [Sedimenticola sp.]
TKNNQESRSDKTTRIARTHENSIKIHDMTTKLCRQQTTNQEQENTPPQKVNIGIHVSSRNDKGGLLRARITFNLS